MLPACHVRSKSSMSSVSRSHTCAESMSGTSEKDEKSNGDGQVWEVEGRHVESG